MLDLYKLFRIVGTSKTGLVEKFGKFTHTIEPGFHFNIPLVQKIIIVNNKKQTHRIISESSKTKDNVFVRTDLSVQYIINTKDSYQSYYSMDYTLDYLHSLCCNSIISFMSKYNLEEVYQNEEKLIDNVFSIAKRDMQPVGFSILSVAINEINPSKEVKERMDNFYTIISNERKSKW